MSVEIQIATERDKVQFGYESVVIPRVGEDVYNPATGELWRITKVQHLVKAGPLGKLITLSHIHCQAKRL